MSVTTEINNLSINQVPPDLGPPPPVGGRPNPNPNCVAGAGGNIFNPNLFSLAKVIGILDTFHDFAKGSRIADIDADIVAETAATTAANIVCMPNELLAGLDATGKVNAVIKYVTNGQGGSVKGNYERGIEEVFEDNERYTSILGQFDTNVSIQEIIRSKLQTAARGPGAAAAEEIDSDGRADAGAILSKRPELWKELCGEYIPGDVEGRDTKIALGPALTKRKLNVFWDDNDNGVHGVAGQPLIEAHTVMNVENGKYMRILADFITKYLYPEQKGLESGSFIFDMNSGSIGKIFTALPQINASINELGVSDSAPTSLKQIGKDESRNTISFIKTQDTPIGGNQIETYMSQGNIFSWNSNVRFYFLNTDYYGGINNWSNFTLKITIGLGDAARGYDIKFNLVEKMGPSVAYLSSLIGALKRGEPLPDVPSGHHMVNITPAFNAMKANDVEVDLMVAILFDIKRCGDWEQSRAAQIASSPAHAARGTPNTMFCTGDVLCSLFSRLSNGNVIWHNEEGDGAMGWKISLYRTPNVGTAIPKPVQDCINIIRKSKTLELILDRICHASELQSSFCKIADYAYQAITSRAVYQINDKNPAAAGTLLGDLEILCTQICRLGAADTYFRALEFIHLLANSNLLLRQLTGINVEPQDVCANLDAYVFGLNYFRDLFDNYEVTNVAKAETFLAFTKKSIFAIRELDISRLQAHRMGDEDEKADEALYIANWINAEKAKRTAADGSVVDVDASIETIISGYVSNLGRIDPVSEIRKVLDALTEIPVVVKDKIVVPEGGQALPRTDFQGYKKNLDNLGDYLQLGQSYSELIRRTADGRIVFKNGWNAPWGFSFSISSLRPFVNYVKQMYNDLTERLRIQVPAEGAAAGAGAALITRKVANFAEFKAAVDRNALVPPLNVQEDKYVQKPFLRSGHNATYSKLTSSKKGGYAYIVEKITFNNRAIFDIVHKGFIAPNLFNTNFTALDIQTDATPFTSTARGIDAIPDVLESLKKYSLWLAKLLNNGTYLRDDSLDFMKQSIDAVTTNVCRENPEAAAAAGRLAYEVGLPDVGMMPETGQITPRAGATYRELVMFSEYGNNTDANITEFNSIMYYAVKSLMIGKEDINGFNKLPVCYASAKDINAADLPRECTNQKAIADHTTAVARMPAGGGKMKGGAITPAELMSWQTAVLDDFLFEICGIAQASIEPLIGNLSTLFQILESKFVDGPEKVEITTIKLALEYCEIGNLDGKAAFDSLYPGVSAAWGGQGVPVRKLIGPGPLLPGYEKLFFRALNLYSSKADKYNIEMLGFYNTVSRLQELLQEFIFNNSNNSNDYNLILDNPKCSGLYFLAKFLSNNMNQENQNRYLKTTFEPIYNTREEPNVFARRLVAGFEQRQGGVKTVVPKRQSVQKSSRNVMSSKDRRKKQIADLTSASRAAAQNRRRGRGVGPRVAVPPSVPPPAVPAGPYPVPPSVPPPAPPAPLEEPEITLNAFKILFSLSLYSNFLQLKPALAQAKYYSSKLLQLFLATPANIRYLYTSGDIGNWYTIRFVEGKIMHQLITIYLKIDTSQINGNFTKANKESIAILSGGKKKQTRKKKKKHKKTRRNKKNHKQTKRKNKKKHKQTKRKR